MSNLAEDALTGEEQAMIDMMKMMGCKLEWEMMSSGAVRIKMWTPDRPDDHRAFNFPHIINGNNMNDAVRCAFERWNVYQNGEN